MKISFLPYVITEKLTDLTPQFLHLHNIRLLMLDFDNTIVPYTTSVPTQEMADWLRQMNQSETQLCVVSNSRNDRVKKFCAEYGLDCITHAAKPGGRGIRQCLDQYAVPAAQAALVGIRR